MFERRLFHGSPYAEEIAEKGFLTSKSQSAGITFQQEKDYFVLNRFFLSIGGHYFSDLSSYSDSYARKSGSGSNLKMLICRVAMGKLYQAGKGPVAGYHSFQSGNEFVVYDEKQV